MDITDPVARTVEVYGLTTAYLEAGDPAAPDLVLLHDGAFGSDAGSCFAGVIPELARTYHVLAPDLLGHGGTAKVFRFDMDPMGQRLWHLSGWRDAVGVDDDAAYVGSSFGGGMVLHAAVRRAFPLRAGVTLCGPGGVLMDPERFAPLRSYEPSLAAAGEIAALLQTDPSEEEIERRYRATLEPGHWEVLAAGRVSNPALEEGPDWRPRYQAGLGTIEVPVLVVAGADDPLMVPGWHEELASMIPTAGTAVVEGARHLVHIDQPEVVLGLLADHLGG